MRFLHLADLHIGKVLHKHNLLVDQAYILDQIVTIAKEQQVEAVLIAGDIYQRNTPQPEAMTLFSDFLAKLTASGLPCYIISGNHDSAERIAYLSQIAERSGIYIAGAEQGRIYSYPLQDSFGELTIHLMPFLTPLQVRALYAEHYGIEQIKTYEDAVRFVLQKNPVSGNGRHILVAHQFLTGAETCDSEELAVGGLDNISAALFQDYDYVALGHLHGPQRVLRDTIRYAGSPLKYSFSEMMQKKSVTIVDILEKGNIKINLIPLHPLHDMQELTGSFASLMQHEKCNDYVKIILTDENPPTDVNRQLRTVFPRYCTIELLNGKMRDDLSVTADAMPEKTDFLDLLTKFYAFQNNGAVMNARQQEIVQDILSALDETEAIHDEA